jgi:YrbI family 3-deoxy-D-manno-octulosonate 8-phosphate phosphatase
METLSILKDVRILAMDFDGVHTDGFVYTNEDGVEFVRCSRRDSLGLELLKQQGIKLCVISKEKNPVVLARCNKLQVECYQGVHNSSNKKEILKEFAEREGVEQKDVRFIGDDVNDI